MTSPATAIPFQTIAPFLAVGAHSRGNWRAIHTLPLVVLVGVTGVGKSTLLSELTRQGANYLLLPDRRDLTDQFIISAMQAADGMPLTPVKDRGQRFAYTRRYREMYAGGMAHALTQLWISADIPADLLVFDGLRGANEVEYAASTLPLARFVMLDAPDLVRLQRLLGRGDAFDHITLTAPAQGDATSFVELGLPEANAIFTPAEEATILSWLHNGLVSSDDLRAKLQIVIEERRSYDPGATRAALLASAPTALLYLDTVRYDAASCAQKTIQWLKP